MERRLDDAVHAQRESLEQERQALGTALERQQVEVSAAATAMQAEATRHAEKSVETLASQARPRVCVFACVRAPHTLAPTRRLILPPPPTTPGPATQENNK